MFGSFVQLFGLDLGQCPQCKEHCSSELSNATFNCSPQTQSAELCCDEAERMRLAH
jgi:hypothetical protein